MTRRYGAKHVFKSKCTKHVMRRHFGSSEDEMSPSCGPKHMQIKMRKIPVLWLTGADDVGTSQRVIGCARLAYLPKRKLVQKEPLMVLMIAAMENFVCNYSFLICTFMRGRFPVNLVDFTADSFEQNGRPGGFVQARVVVDPSDFHVPFMKNSKFFQR